MTISGTSPGRGPGGDDRDHRSPLVRGGAVPPGAQEPPDAATPALRIVHRGGGAGRRSATARLRPSRPVGVPEVNQGLTRGPGIGDMFETFRLIAGPCTLEDDELNLEIARGLVALAEETGLAIVFKGSFDKANRSRIASPRGPGLDAGLERLAAVRSATGLPVLTDIHEPHQAAPVAEVVDVLQIPAFLCRQTDLLVAAGRTGAAVNVKKGQWMAPEEMGAAVQKVREAGASEVAM